ncbi:hypothetical protein HAX54_046680, partial [Datura stramonium]|nr:hypothetical protein [Datura stramonium]
MCGEEKFQESSKRKKEKQMEEDRGTSMGLASTRSNARSCTLPSGDGEGGVGGGVRGLLGVNVAIVLAHFWDFNNVLSTRINWPTSDSPGDSGASRATRRVYRRIDWVLGKSDMDAKSTLAIVSLRRKTIVYAISPLLLPHRFLALYLSPLETYPFGGRSSLVSY